MNRQEKWQQLFDWIVTTGLAPEEIMDALTKYQKVEVKAETEEDDVMQTQLVFESMG